MLTTFCVLSTDANLTAFHVDIDETLIVEHLKDAIHLTLVRVFKGDVGGFTAEELGASKEVMDQVYAEDEDEGKAVDSGHGYHKSVSGSTSGTCKTYHGLTFKLMNPTEQLSIYFPPKKTLSCAGSTSCPFFQPFKEVTWNPHTINCHHTYDETQPLFELSSDYFVESGLVPPATSKLVLECGSVISSNSSTKRVVGASRLGWILGPPGTGKSATCLALRIVVRFNGASTRCTLLPDTNMDLMWSVLDEIQGNHVVFLDGFLMTGHKHLDIVKCCHAWRHGNKDTRRLVVVSSMLCRDNLYDEVHGIEEFFV
ncbi:hypothetical protein BCR33DRAFT_857170 [Rhizoclosmatium globosum]|uniref:Uncharacterized protein n=1 Tax=Rhizoclosmatium globosum TaxID=329046 RepID=A0A1Y2B7T6_9FUNG|nr:hypothetical protein BCR33DRAFT_857170 [Rhizoclosmatium globosum]|eukprot:ORY30911.1 hypothetical protein BCR33DRAFT_857170 [Rhizoclosmatium globosum]